MNKLSVKHLRYFRALAQHRHFGRAAQACAISQPALSLQIKELEDILGGQLIERTARQLRLTALGADILARAERIVLAIDELGDVARAHAGPLSGVFRIGLIPTVAPYMLPQMITKLRRAYPAVEVVPSEATTAKLLAAIKDARLDAAVMALPVSDPALASHVLLREDFVLLEPAGAATAQATGITAAGWRGKRMLLLEDGHCFRDQALSYCKIAPAARADIIEGSNLSTLVQMVAAGIGVTLLPAMAVKVETAKVEPSRARVKVTPLPAPQAARSIALVWRRDNPLARQIAEAAQLLAQKK